MGAHEGKSHDRKLKGCYAKYELGLILRIVGSLGGSGSSQETATMETAGDSTLWLQQVASFPCLLPCWAPVRQAGVSFFCFSNQTVFISSVVIDFVSTNHLFSKWDGIAVDLKSRRVHTKSTRSDVQQSQDRNLSVEGAIKCYQVFIVW